MATLITELRGHVAVAQNGGDEKAKKLHVSRNKLLVAHQRSSRRVMQYPCFYK